MVVQQLSPLLQGEEVVAMKRSHHNSHHDNRNSSHNSHTSHSTLLRRSRQALAAIISVRLCLLAVQQQHRHTGHLVERGGVQPVAGEEGRGWHDQAAKDAIQHQQNAR